MIAGLLLVLLLLCLINTCRNMWIIRCRHTVCRCNSGRRRSAASTVMNTFGAPKLQNHSIELNAPFLPIWCGSLKLMGPHANTIQQASGIILDQISRISGRQSSILLIPGNKKARHRSCLATQQSIGCIESEARISDKSSYFTNE